LSRLGACSVREARYRAQFLVMVRGMFRTVQARGMFRMSAYLAGSVPVIVCGRYATGIQSGSTSRTRNSVKSRSCPGSLRPLHGGSGSKDTGQSHCGMLYISYHYKSSPIHFRVNLNATCEQRAYTPRHCYCIHCRARAHGTDSCLEARGCACSGSSMATAICTRSRLTCLLLTLAPDRGCARNTSASD